MRETSPYRGPPIVGSVLGNYRIRGELGTGGMGTVFRATHVVLGRPAAIKLLRPELTSDPTLVQRFINEARAVTACKHPGIIEVYDFGYTPEGHAYLVMELLTGETLGRRMAQRRLTEPEAASIAHGIASALGAAHQVGVVHRDLKPDNVFLVPAPDGGPDRIKVLDFGIAKLADGLQSGGRHTQTGVLIGTPLYMAPEQARAAGSVDHRADLYSLGCLLYHMLVGRPPFVAPGSGEIIALQLFGEVEPPSRFGAIRPELEQLVRRLLEKEPDARPASAAEVAAALAPGEVGRAPAAVARAVSTTSLEPAPRRRSATAIVAGALGVLAVTGVAISYAGRDRGGAPPAAAAPAPIHEPLREPEPSVSPPHAPGGEEQPAEQRSATAPRDPAPKAAPAARPHKPQERARPRITRPPRVPVVAPPATERVPDKAIEVHRELPPVRGLQTTEGSPIETTVELDTRRPRVAPAPPAPAPTPKETSLP